MRRKPIVNKEPVSEDASHGRKREEEKREGENREMEGRERKERRRRRRGGVATAAL